MLIWWKSLCWPHYYYVSFPRALLTYLLAYSVSEQLRNESQTVCSAVPSLSEHSSQHHWRRCCCHTVRCLLWSIYTAEVKTGEILRPMMDSEKSKTDDRDLPEKSPKRGPTLSTSTSSFEALDPHDPQLNHLASIMFSKTSDWIAGSVHIHIQWVLLLSVKHDVAGLKFFKILKGLVWRNKFFFMGFY